MLKYVSDSSWYDAHLVLVVLFQDIISSHAESFTWPSLAIRYNSNIEP